MNAFHFSSEFTRQIFMLFIKTSFISFRFHLYMHDQMKAKFLEENKEQWKKEFIEKISVPGYEFFPNMTQQRFVKTHLPMKLLPLA